MYHNYRDFPGIAFVAGRTFQTEHGTHEAGTVVKEALEINNLDVLVSAGFLLPFSPADGYDYLPAHLFSHTNLREDLLDHFAGDDSFNTKQFDHHGQPQIVTEAMAQAQEQEKLYPQLLEANRTAGQRAAEEQVEREKREPTGRPHETAHRRKNNRKGKS